MILINNQIYVGERFNAILNTMSINIFTYNLLLLNLQDTLIWEIKVTA